MGWFSNGSEDVHEGGWVNADGSPVARKGNSDSHVVARGGTARQQKSDRDPSFHAQQRPALGLISWGSDARFLRVSGEKPGGGRQR